MTRNNNDPPRDFIDSYLDEMDKQILKNNKETTFFSDFIWN